MNDNRSSTTFRWIIGLPMDDTEWGPTVFTKKRKRLIKHDAIIEFFNEVLAIAEQRKWGGRADARSRIMAPTVFRHGSQILVGAACGAGRRPWPVCPAARRVACAGHCTPIGD